MFGQVQSELRYAIVISISYNCLYVQKEMFGFRVSSEMHAMRRRRQKGCPTAQETNNYQEKEAEIEKLSGNKQKIKQQLKVVWSLRKTPTIRVNMKR